MLEYTLVDAWRIRNHEKFTFTWKRRTPRAYARLDYFLMPAGLTNLVHYIKILPGFRSDHSLIQMVIEFKKVERGPGYWKFNNSLLQNEAFVNKLKIMVDKILAQYENNQGNNPAQIWEILKYEIAKYSHEQSVYISKERGIEITKLQTKLKELEDSLVLSLDNQIPDKIVDVQRKINEYYEIKTNPVAFKSEILLIHNIEKYNAVKSNKLEKHMIKWHNVNVQTDTDIVFSDYIW